jgi:hypothetical protein
MPRLPEEAVVFGSSLSQARFNSVRSISHAVQCNRIK